LNLALLMPAIYMMQVFDRVFASRSVETLVMLSLITLLFLVLGYFVDTARTRALASAGRSLDRQLSAIALDTSLREAALRDGRGEGDLLRDIAKLRSFLSGTGILAMFDAPWLPLYLLIIGLMHPVLGAIATIGALTLASLGWLTERLTRGHTDSAVRETRATQQHAEMLNRNAEVIVGMGMTGNAVDSWQLRQNQVLGAQSRLNNASSSLGALARALRQVLQVAMLGIGAWLVIDAAASPGIMIAATILIGRALQPVEHLISGWKALIEARGAWARISARTVMQTMAASPAKAVSLPAPSGHLDIERLVYSPVQGKPPLIKGVAFSLMAGESLGIMGPSASGKTTLARLILGLRKAHAGIVRLDGSDIASWERNDLGRHIGYLPQDVELFAGSVAENIARLGAVDSSKVVRAAQLAHAHEMILRLPDGYATQIGEAGAALSGGQRQRIALARALHDDPRLIVLDEPNANLDSEGEAALFAAIEEFKRSRTTLIVVAHNAALLSRMDKLLMLKDGALEAFGPAGAVLARLHALTSPASRVVPISRTAEAHS
jgi:PrtD family type I secretion system ABC transporter